MGLGVYCLIDQPGMHNMISPVCRELVRRDIPVSGHACWAGTHIDTVPGGAKKIALYDLLLLCTDINIPQNVLGRALCNASRHIGIPSISIQHAPYLLYEDFPQGVEFSADICCVFSESYKDMYQRFGLGHKCLVTGNPKMDTFYNKVTKKKKVSILATVGHGFSSHVNINNVAWKIENLTETRVVHKPHPSEVYFEGSPMYNGDTLPSEDNIQEHIVSSMFVFTHSPSVAMESMLLDTPVCFMTDGPLSSEMKFLKQFGMLVCKSDASDLKDQPMIPCLLGREKETLNYMNDGNASARIAEFIEYTLKGYRV